MIKKKLTKVLGVALLSATVVTSASPAFANTSAKETAKDTVISEALTETSKTTTEATNENEKINTNAIKAESKEEAVIQNGWVKNENGRWSYFVNGNIIKGMYHPYPGTTYYFFEDGTSATGWTEINGNMYYFKENASGGYKMAYKEFIDGFYLDQDGVRQADDSEDAKIKNGWVEAEDGNSYFYRDDEMVKGWLNYAPSRTFYFHEDGRSAKGWTEIDGKTYFFKENPFGDGYIMAANEFVDGFYLDKDGVKHDDDSFVQRGWVQGEDGNWRYYNNDGRMNTGLCTIHPNQTFYFDKETGASLSGWQEINGKLRYFKQAECGYIMAMDETIDGKYINQSGYVEE